MDEDLALALRLAREGGELAQRHLTAGVAATTKVDGTVASRADAEVERHLKDVLARERPDDAVLGEELGGEDGAPHGRRWVLDPVDGTAQFVRGHPTWAVQVTLEDVAGPRVAVVHAPAHGRTWTAVRGAGAHDGEARLQVSAVRSIAEATVITPDLQRLARTPALDPVLRLLDQARAGLGGESFWSYVHIARGHADLGVVPIAYRWDWAPGVLLVREAGGAAALTDVLGLDGPAVLLANSPDLLEELRGRLGA